MEECQHRWLDPGQWYSVNMACPWEVGGGGGQGQDTHTLRTMSKREQRQTASDAPNQFKNLHSLHVLRFKVKVLTRMDVLNSSTPHCALGWLHTKHAAASNTRHFPSSCNGTPCCGPASTAFATAGDKERAKLLRWLMMLKRAADFSNTAAHFTLRLPGAFGVLHEWQHSEPHALTSHNGSCYANHVSPTHRPHKTVGFHHSAGFGVETALWCPPLYLRSRGFPSSQPSASSEMPPWEEEPRVPNPIWLPSLSARSENGALWRLISKLCVVKKSYWPHCAPSTCARVVFVPLRSNYHIVCRYMQIRAKNAKENKRRTYLTFPTYT